MLKKETFSLCGFNPSSAQRRSGRCRLRYLQERNRACFNPSSAQRRSGSHTAGTVLCGLPFVSIHRPPKGGLEAGMTGARWTRPACFNPSSAQRRSGSENVSKFHGRRMSCFNPSSAQRRSGSKAARTHLPALSAVSIHRPPKGGLEASAGVE